MNHQILRQLLLGALLLSTGCHRSAPGAAGPRPTTAGTSSTNLFQRMAKGAETPKINPQQLDVYLAQEHRSATSLLAASRVTGDETLLEEALRAQPADPRVALAALTRPGGAREGRHSLIVAFKKSAPDNSLPNYLAALEEFRAGQPNQAVRELGAAAKNPLQDYSADFVASSRAAYQAAGCSPADAATAAQLALPLPHLVQLKELAQAIVDLAVKYRQSGN